jgi:hypothetical protein
LDEVENKRQLDLNKLNQVVEYLETAKGAKKELDNM